VKRVAIVLGAVAALAGAAVLLVVLAGGDDSSAAGDPHAGAKDVPASVLRAAEAGAADRSQEELAAEGRKLFESTAVALTGESCAGCHTAGGGVNAEVGTTPHPQTEGDFTGPRDPPPLWDVARTAPYGWDGAQEDLTAFVAGTIKTHFKEGASQPVEETGRQAAALVAYLKTIKPPATRFDQGTMSDAALRGEALFQGKGGCIECHVGASFTDGLVHNLNVPLADGDNDWGAAKSSTDPLFRAFNTPSLRDVRNTAPYMHNGHFKTLEEVVDFYNGESSVAPLNLTAAEKADLVAYLESL
jgi:cytochrome c peroxidase